MSCFLFGTKEVNGLRVDIWGEGCEIAGVETDTYRQNKMSIIQCSILFCCIQGKNSRFALEQNLGPAVAGVQKSGWLFNETLELSKRGVLLTYSEDSPFLMRLVLGTTNESVSPSKIPL